MEGEFPPPFLLMEFDEIVEKYTGRLFKMVYWLCGDYNESEDIVQEVFSIAWKNWKSFRGEASVYTWLYRIALNRVRRWHKKEKPLPLDDAKDISNNSNPEKDFGIMEMRRELINAIGKLPQKLREPFVLKYIEDMDYQSISKSLRIPLGTVRSRLARARERLKDLLKPWMEEP